MKAILRTIRKFAIKFLMDQFDRICKMIDYLMNLSSYKYEEYKHNKWKDKGSAERIFLYLCGFDMDMSCVELVEKMIETKNRIDEYLTIILNWVI